MTIDFQKIDWFVAGISGGKDSTALLLYLKFEFFPLHNIPPYKLIATFADTDNEAEETYRHIWLISRQIRRVKWLTSEGFYNLAKRKRRFPPTQSRFCTTNLKLEPTKEFMNTLQGTVLSVSGIRADESDERKKMSEFGDAFESYHGYAEWRPLLKWDITDVFLIHKKYKFPLNPLYQWYDRVGCKVCFFRQKHEIRHIAQHHPEWIDEIRERENTFPNRNNFSSFFNRNKVPERYRSKEIVNKKGEVVLVPTIDDVVVWSKTADRKRGSQYDFHFEDYENPFEESSCMAGVCE